MAKFDDDDEMYVTLSLDEGDVKCAIVTIFSVGDKDYIALLPLDENDENEDGEVWIYGHSEDEDGNPIEVPSEPEEGSFQAASLGKRAAIIFAGPFFNFILAFIGAVIIISIVGYDPAEIVYVQEGSPAAEAGLPRVQQRGQLAEGGRRAVLVRGDDRGGGA